MIRTYLLSALGVAALLLNAAARADDAQGFYIGAGAGEVSNEAGAFDGHGVGVKLFGGYELNRYFAAEAAYIYAGVLEDTIDDVDVEVESDGFIVSVLGKLPLSDAFTLFAKLGYTFYDQEVSARRENLRASEKNSDEDLLYGVGAEITLGRRFQLRAEYEVVDVADADFDLLSASAVFRF